MEKLKLLIFVLGVGLLSLNSCGGSSDSGSSMDSDAKRVAKLICEAQELMQNPTDMAKATKLSGEAQQLQAKLSKKYKSDEEQNAFADAVSRETGKCK